MRGLILGAVIVAGTATGGCAMNETATGSVSPTMASGGEATATVTLVNGAGAPNGSAELRQTSGGLRLTVMATGMTPGPKGLHLHTTGKCEGPAFTTAGGHWNPGAMKHGKDSGMGPHRGDLPNIEIGADGTGRAEATIPDAMLTGGATPLLDVDGAALIVHAAADDYRTDPSGNSGARLACGVVTPA